MFLKHKPTLKSVIYPSGQPHCDLQKFQDVHCHLCTTEVNRTQSSKTFHILPLCVVHCPLLLTHP